jgi:signal transduction histidine kinase
VYGITFDDDGNVWFLSQRGISILRTDSSGVESFEKFDVNTRMEGIAASPLQIGDRLYILTDDGIFITQNQYFKEKSEKTPNVLITNLLINGVPDSKITAKSNNIRLTHEQRNLTIEFSAITFKNAHDVSYQYKLEGGDDEWSLLSDRGYVEYASMNPGRYTFKVRAAVAGAEVGEETSLTFRVRPAYWQTTWFYLLIFIAIASLLYTFYQYRIRQIIKVERMRIRIASDLHDDIGSTLSSISLISEMASRQDKESALAKVLSKIGDDSRDVLSSMDDIIWSVNPQNDSLLSLTGRLREFAIPVCESKNITFTMHVDETIYSMKLGMDERRNIYLISKEAINNAVKHSGCSQLSVSFLLNHKQLEIKITDDGCGFDPSIRGFRNGITNMERRAKQIGVEFNIQSENNTGTAITLKHS